MSLLENKKFLAFKKNIEKPSPINQNELHEVRNILKEEYDVSTIYYPYKPALILSLLKYTEKTNEELFNNEIEVAKLAKFYYDILMNSDIMSMVFKSHKSKDTFYLGFNESNMKKVINNICSMPAIKLTTNNEIWKFDKKRKVIGIYFDFDNEDQKKEFKNLLGSICLKQIQKCIPEYKNLNLENIYEYEDYMLKKWTLEQDEITLGKKRIYQHIYAKKIKDRDGKCMICNVSMLNILEACHVKPYKDCDNKDKYNPDNGITMCRNHHKLFDLGIFSFDENWNMKISKILDEENKNYLLLQYANIYYKNFKILKENINTNDFINYHKSFIFKG